MGCLFLLATSNASDCSWSHPKLLNLKLHDAPVIAVVMSIAEIITIRTKLMEIIGIQSAPLQRSQFVVTYMKDKALPGTYGCESMAESFQQDCCLAHLAFFVLRSFGTSKASVFLLLRDVRSVGLREK